MTDTLVHNEWVKVDEMLPIPNVIVEVAGSDYLGGWVSQAKWIPYKGVLPKNDRKHGRWLYSNGIRLGSYGEVDKWREKQ